jgi:lipooligosaccharide transport system permease protein
MTSVAARPRRFGTWYVFEHLIRGYRAYGLVTGVQALGTPLLTWLAFGLGVGGLVAVGTGGQGVNGVPYLAFVFPALMCGLTLQVWVDDAMFGTMLGISWRRTFVAMRSGPIGVPQIAGGFVLQVAVRAFATALPYWCIALLVGAMVGPWSWLGIFAALLGAAAFGLPLMAYSAHLKSESGQFALVGRFVILPLSLFSGTMFPLSVMPIWLQWIGWLSPLWHASQLARAASTGVDEPLWLLAVHVGYLLALTDVGWLLVVAVFKRKLES